MKESRKYCTNSNQIQRMLLGKRRTRWQIDPGTRKRNICIQSLPKFTEFWTTKNINEDMAMAMNNEDMVSICTPRTWQQMSSGMLLCQLSRESEEFKSVVRKINNTLRVYITSVVRVQNPYLWGSYQLKKLEYKAKNIPIREIQMFHCTATSSIDSIATDNLDWRLCTRSKFGQGVSFSPSAEYANKYANYNIGLERATILTSVLVGRETEGDESMTIPPKSYDTSYGNRNGRGTMVYVKYCDHEFYPTHVAYYTRLEDPRSCRGQNISVFDDGIFEACRALGLL